MIAILGDFFILIAFNRNIAGPLSPNQDYNMDKSNSIKCEQCMKLTGTMIVTQGDLHF